MKLTYAVLRVSDEAALQRDLDTFGDAGYRLSHFVSLTPYTQVAVMVREEDS